MPASIRIGPYDFNHTTYDEEGDVLYLSVGEPQEAADSQETPEGHVVRYDNDEHITGVSIVNARWMFDLDQAVAVTLPGRSAPGLGRLVQIEPASCWPRPSTRCPRSRRNGRSRTTASPHRTGLPRLSLPGDQPR